MDWGANALLGLLSSHNDHFSNVLDVGSGGGEHTRFLRFFGKDARSIDLHEDADYQGDFATYEFPKKFDAIFCSHVLEHQRNVGHFVEKLYDSLADDGILAISVPCHDRQHLLGGHITNWNSGLLVYNLVLGGFDCRQASIYQHLDVNLVVRKKPARGLDVRSSAAWTPVVDLQEFFPFPICEGGNAEVESVNWNHSYVLPHIGRSVTLNVKSRTVGDLTAKCH